MSDSQTSAPTKWHPPYIAFRTLTDLIERMEQEEPPSRIDKSYLDNYSGGYQSIVIAALNNLGLRDASGALTQRLLDLVGADIDKRKAMVSDLLREYYAPVLALGVNATQAQLIEGIRDLGVNPGDTTRKVIAFFLAAARYAGMPVSRHWRVPSVPSSGTRKKKEPVAQKAAAAPVAPVVTETPGPTGSNGSGGRHEDGDGGRKTGDDAHEFLLPNAVLR